MSAPPIKSISWAGNDVCLCGIGARSSLGLDAAATAAAVRAGISGISVHPKFLDKADEPMAFASDALLDEHLPLAERMAQMLASVLAEAGDGTAVTGRGVRTACWVGLPEARAGIDESVGRACSAAFTKAGLPVPQVLARGHAAGLMALQAAAQCIASRAADLAWVAGVDSYQDARTLTVLDQAGWLMSAIHRNGFPPGEGAGACLLASRAAAQRLGLPLLGTVTAVSTAMEPVSIRNTESVCVGAGLTTAFREVIATLRLPGEPITATYCDLNGQRYRNEELVYTLLRTQEAFVDAHDYLCPADCWGDVGAASGPLFVALAVAAAQRGYSKGPRPLLWAGSESGHRSAALLNLASA